MSTANFVQRFGGIYENSSWVAESAAPHVGASTDIDQVARLMADCVDNASRETQLELIRAHPDLAGRAAVAGELTEASSVEQSSAGLDQCTREQFEQFTILNDRYRKKFGFPFVMAVRKSSRDEILAAFERRLGSDYDVEFETALAEIHKIARLRLVAIAEG